MIIPYIRTKYDSGMREEGVRTQLLDGSVVTLLGVREMIELWRGSLDPLTMIDSTLAGDDRRIKRPMRTSMPSNTPEGRW
jgi:hypothetical protein